MEGAPDSAAPPRRSRRILLALVVAAVVVAAGFAVWWAFVRTRTISEVFLFDHFTPGTSVVVQGTITGIHRENTSAGPKVFLALDHESLCNDTGQVFGDPNATYTVGQSFQTTLHFQAYAINGDTAVSAPELACPLPGLFADMREVLDVVSMIRGILLVSNGSQAGGWQEYDVVTQNDYAFNLSTLPVFLAKSVPVVGINPRLPSGTIVDSIPRWQALFELQYVGASGGAPNLEFPLVDQMKSLQDGTSVNGSFRFIDANGDRLLDDGDRLDVHLPSTAAATAWDTYLLQVGVFGGPNATYAASEHFILQGPQGPLDPLLSSQRAWVDLAYAGTQAGPPLRSTIQVASVLTGVPRPLSTVRYSLAVNNPGSFDSLSGNLTSLPATSAGGATISFTDSNQDGLLDAGDRLAFTGTANRTHLSLTLFYPEGGGGQVDWIVGYGPIVGRVPYPTFTVQGSGLWTIGADVPSWSPYLSLNGTLQVTLLENDTQVITNASLRDGTLGTYANGSLSFTDADGNGFLSTGDRFTLRGIPVDRYELRITVLFGVYVFRAFT